MVQVDCVSELNRNQFLILMSLFSNGATDKYHGMTISEIMEENDGNIGGSMYVWRSMKKLVNACYVAKGIKDNHADTYYLIDKGLTVCKGED